MALNLKGFCTLSSLPLTSKICLFLRDFQLGQCKPDRSVFLYALSKRWFAWQAGRALVQSY